MSEQDRNLLKALARRLVYLLKREKNLQAAYQEVTQGMSRVERLDGPGDRSDPEAFAESVTTQNPALQSAAPFLRERKQDMASVVSLQDWVDAVS